MLFREKSNLYTRRSLIFRLYQCWDALLLLLCLSLAIFINNPEQLIKEILLFFIDHYLFTMTSVAIWYFSFIYFNLYESKRLDTKLDLVGIVKATSVGLAFIVVAAELLKTGLNTPKFVLVLWALSSLGAIITRAALNKVLAITRLKEHNLRHIIIVGLGERAQSFTALLKLHPEIGYRVIGFVDDKQHIKELNINPNEFELLGGLEDFPDILSATTIDEVYICLPIKSYYDEIDAVVNQCKEQGIPARLSGDFFHLEKVKTKIGFLGKTPIITLYNGMEESLELTIKRVLDVCISGFLMVLLLPLLIMVAIMVKYTSKGPVIFAQKRIGLHKREFKLYKFRTMVSDAELLQTQLEQKNEASGPVFKISDDPRITSIGGFLRKYSIDELPQLLNVFFGEMSLVGPRPLPLRDFEKFEENWTRRRFSVRPGITCIWQTSGRSNLSFEQWMELDLKYIDNWSLKLDFIILSNTIPAILKGTGAY